MRERVNAAAGFVSITSDLPNRQDREGDNSQRSKRKKWVLGRNVNIYFGKGGRRKREEVVKKGDQSDPFTTTVRGVEKGESGGASSKGLIVSDGSTKKFLIHLSKTDAVRPKEEGEKRIMP